jgi:hypothetical protein
MVSVSRVHRDLPQLDQDRDAEDQSSARSAPGETAICMLLKDHISLMLVLQSAGNMATSYAIPFLIRPMFP